MQPSAADHVRLEAFLPAVRGALRRSALHNARAALSFARHVGIGVGVEAPSTAVAAKAAAADLVSTGMSTGSGAV